MKISDPFGGDYDLDVPEYGKEISFRAKGECGMGGPTQGVLNIVGLGSYQNALRCVNYSTEKPVFVFLTWRPSNGGAIVVVHIMNMETNHVGEQEVKFGAYEVNSVDCEKIELIDSYNGQLTKIEYGENT